MLEKVKELVTLAKVMLKNSKTYDRIPILRITYHRNRYYIYFWHNNLITKISYSPREKYYRLYQYKYLIATQRWYQPISKSKSIYDQNYTIKILNHLENILLKEKLLIS